MSLTLIFDSGYRQRRAAYLRCCWSFTASETLYCVSHKPPPSALYSATSLLEAHFLQYLIHLIIYSCMDCEQKLQLLRGEACERAGQWVLVLCKGLSILFDNLMWYFVCCAHADSPAISFSIFESFVLCLLLSAMSCWMTLISDALRASISV